MIIPEIEMGDIFTIRVVLSLWLSAHDDDPNAAEVKKTLAKIQACG